MVDVSRGLILILFAAVNAEKTLTKYTRVENVVDGIKTTTMSPVSCAARCSSLPIEDCKAIHLDANNPCGLYSEKPKDLPGRDLFLRQDILEDSSPDDESPQISISSDANGTTYLALISEDDDTSEEKNDVSVIDIAIPQEEEESLPDTICQAPHMSSEKPELLDKVCYSIQLYTRFCYAPVVPKDEQSLDVIAGVDSLLDSVMLPMINGNHLRLQLVWDETNRDLVGFNVSELESVIPWKERTLSVFEFFGEYSPASVGIFNETTLILCRFDETLLHVLNTTSTVPGPSMVTPRGTYEPPPMLLNIKDIDDGSNIVLMVGYVCLCYYDSKRKLTEEQLKNSTKSQIFIQGRQPGDSANFRFELGPRAEHYLFSSGFANSPANDRIIFAGSGTNRDDPGFHGFLQQFWCKSHQCHFETMKQLMPKPIARESFQLRALFIPESLVKCDRK